MGGAASNYLPLELTNLTGTQFMDLNDDCLRQILTQTLAMDLCSLLELSQTSRNVRLKALTNEIFQRKYKSIDLKEVATTVDEVERLLTNFGSLISHLIVAVQSDATRKIDSIIQWCSGTLKGLDLTRFTFVENETKALKALFGNLESLSLYRCRFQGDVADLFSSCKSLKSLTVFAYEEDNEAIWQSTFSGLKEFSCLHSNRKFDFENFLSRHKKLKLIHMFNMRKNPAILPVLARNCAELTELSIWTDGTGDPVQYKTSVKSISALKNLKKLEICFDPNALVFIRELNNLPSLTTLQLYQVRCVTGLVSDLVQLKMLEVLVIQDCECFSLTDFNQLAELYQLKELKIASSEVVSIDVVYMVARLVALEKLVLNLRDFTIDERMHSRIKDVRSKSGSAQRTLQIECNSRHKCASEFEFSMNRWMNQ